VTQPSDPPVVPSSVSPSPRLPKATLIQLIQLTSGLQSVVWATDRRPHLGQQPGREHAWITLAMQSWQNIGVDELRYSFNAATGNNDSVTVGQRSFTLVVRASSLDPTLEAFDLLERIRFRLRSAQARALMVPTLALRDIQAIQTFPDAVANAGGVARTLLSASMDVRMLCVVGADQGDAGEGTFIETAPVPAPAVGGTGGGALIP
jgi:hypothetical protein